MSFFKPSIIDLWLPILVAAVVCFFASALMWALLKYHNRDYKRASDEEAVRAALKGSTPGFYIVPFCLDPADAKNPEMKEKFDEGPLAYITVGKNGMPSMGPNLVGMFIYFVAVSVLAAYFVTFSLTLESDYLHVFRVAATVSFIANSFAVVPESIWFSRPWSMTVKNFIDAGVYSLLTGGIFGWLV